jgi:hypothetical protein
MPQGERLDQQDNCPHREYEREKEAEYRIGLRHTTRDRAEASGLLFGYSPEGMENPNSEWNRQCPSEDRAPMELFCFTLVARAVVHPGTYRLSPGSHENQLSGLVCHAGSVRHSYSNGAAFSGEPIQKIATFRVRNAGPGSSSP